MQTCQSPSAPARLAVWITLLALAMPALAWGPATQSAVVSGAATMLAKQEAVPLTNLLTDLRAGANVSQAQLLEFMPDALDDPVDAIEQEMYLLQAVRTGRVDPYFAYRLGALGRLAASATAPMRDAPPVYRQQFYADVDSEVSSVSLDPEPRRSIDPEEYFAVLSPLIDARTAVLVEEYKAGQGFAGVARMALNEDISRSVNAVANVFYTVLQPQVRVANVSGERRRAYLMQALRYYLDRGYGNEADAVYERLVAMNLESPDLMKEVADLFYAAGRYDRAIEEYRAVLAMRPGDREVAERVAAHYMRVGDEALARDNFVAARDAYQDAAAADPLNREAREKLNDVVDRINQVEDRAGADRAALDAASTLERQANEILGRGGDVAEAIALLTRARGHYTRVSPEFPEERRAAEAGETAVTRRLRELRGQLVQEAQQLSGAASSLVASQVAESNAEQVTQQTLTEMTERAYQSELDALSREMGRQLVEE